MSTILTKNCDVETFIDNSLIYGINIFPSRFGLKTIIEKQDINENNLYLNELCDNRPKNYLLYI